MHYVMRYAIIFVIVVDVDHALSVSHFHDNITGLAHNLTVSTTITRTRAGLDRLSGTPVSSYLVAGDGEAHSCPSILQAPYLTKISCCPHYFSSS